MTPGQMVWMLAVPGVVTVVMLLCASFLARKPVHAGEETSELADGARRPVSLRDVLARILPPVVAAGAFFSIDLGLNQWHSLWPIDGTQRFLAVAIGAGLFGVLHAAAGPALLAILFRLLLGAGLALGVLTPLPDMFMPPGLLIGLTIASGLWLAATGLVFDSAGARLPRVAQPMTLAGLAAVAAFGLFLNKYAGGSLLTAGLGAVAGGGLVVALLCGKRLPALSGLHTVWLAVFAAILLVTFGYQEKASPWSLVCMALAPTGILLGLLPKRALARAALAATATVAIAGLGVLIVGLQSASGDESPEDSYYSY